MNQTIDTIVIGAGISGLTYAYRRQADDLILLESSPRTGGWVQTVAVEEGPSLRYEHGPEALSAAAKGAFSLCNELGLEPQVMNGVDGKAAKRFIVKDKALVEVPLSPPKLVTTKLLSLKAKLRLATEPLRAKKLGLDGSIAEFGRHRLGGEAVERLLDPMVAGIHAGDPDKLSLRACFPQLVSMIEAHGSLFRALRARQSEADEKKPPGLWKPKGGMEGLTQALTECLAPQIRTETEVKGIERAPQGFLVQTNKESYRANRLVFAAPLRSTRTLLRPLHGKAAALLEEMKSESLVGIFQSFCREDVDHPLNGFGYLVPHTEGLGHLGTLFSSSIDPACVPQGEVLLRTLAGGARRTDIIDADEPELFELTGKEVSQLLGIRGKPTWQRIVRYREALPRLDLSHPKRMARLKEVLPTNVSLLGNFTAGVGLSSLVNEALELARLHS